MKLYEKIAEIEEQPMPYGALRVVAAAFNIMGWLVIVLHGIVTIVLVYPFMADKFNEILPALLLSLFVFLIGVLFGVFIIASGQIIELLFDMRRDMRITRRYIRAFGLHFAREQKPTPED
jgi:hypothetical protein